MVFETEILINAPAEKCYDILVDFASFEKWNPFIIKGSGKPQVDEWLKLTLRPPGGSEMGMEPQVQVANRGKEFRWLGKLFHIPGIFTGSHYFIFETTPAGQTKLRQGEEFSGVLAFLMKGSMGQQTMRGFEALNKALKERAESA